MLPRTFLLNAALAEGGEEAQAPLGHSPRAEGCWQESGVCGARGAASCAGVTAVTPSRSSPREEEPLRYHPAAKNPRAPLQALTQADSGVP